MTATEAAAILLEMSLDELSEMSLYDLSAYLCVTPHTLENGAVLPTAVLDSNFTADQLLAIVTWMRAPKAVIEACRAENARFAEWVSQRQRELPP